MHLFHLAQIGKFLHDYKSFANRFYVKQRLCLQDANGKVNAREHWYLVLIRTSVWWGVRVNHGILYICVENLLRFIIVKRYVSVVITEVEI